MTYDQHDVGTYNQEDCPKCNGGHKKEKDLSVTKTHSHLKWICFRASCGFKGIVDHRSGKPLETQQPRVKRPRPYTKPTEVYKGNYLQNSFGVATRTLWNKQDKRILMPVVSSKGSVIGHIARGYKALGWSGEGPKTITYTNTLDEPFMHFASLTTERMVLVEDWVSAEKVSQLCPAVALLGTHMSYKDVLHLKNVGIRDLVVALDADAWNKYSGWHNQFRLFFRSLTFKMWSSQLDPKDMSEEELREVFG